MPYVMKHTTTGTLLSCVQRNGYELAYYGIKLWDDQPSEEHLAKAIIEAGIDPEEQAGNLSEWTVMQLSEHEAKMANVKLSNDPRKMVTYREGIIALKI